MPSWFFIALLFGAVLLIYGIYRLLVERAIQEEFPYVRRRYLCHRAERNFYRYLMAAVGQDFLVLPKVRLGNVIAVKSALKQKKKLAAYDRIARGFIDFVLVDKANTTIKCAIELVIDEEQTVASMRQALFYDQVFKAADLPLLRFRFNDNYAIKDIRKAIHGKLDTPEMAAETASPEATNSSAMDALKRRREQERQQDVPEALKTGAL